MKITSSTVKKHVISSLHGLDPITMIMEDFGPGKGKITLECFGESWAHYWGAMGDDCNIAKFIKTASTCYLVGKLIRGNTTEPDYDSFPQMIRKSIIECRRLNEISKEDARDYYNDAADLVDEHSIQYCRWLNDVDQNWWESIPNKHTSEYDYLTKIIDVVKIAIDEIGVAA